MLLPVREHPRAFIFSEPEFMQRMAFTDALCAMRQSAANPG